MAHTGEEFGFRLAGNIVLLLVKLALDDTAKLCQVLLLLSILQKGR